MARGDTEYYDVDWDRFGEIVIERWQKKMLEKDIWDTGNLYRSIVYNYRATNAMNQVMSRGSGATFGDVKVPDMLSFSFPMYGIYVERGVGRGYTRGNGGDLVKFKGVGRGRERRTWYYRIFANERHKLGEMAAKIYGRAAASMIHTIETHSVSRSRGQSGELYASRHT